MSGIDALVGNVFTEVVEEVAVVMKEAGDDDLGRLSLALGEGGALEGVLGFGDRLAVHAVAIAAVNAEDLVDDFGRSHGGRCWCGRIADGKQRCGDTPCSGGHQIHGMNRRTRAA
jgi:hypothetical protein